MYTLGIGDVTHDPSVALAKNGKVVAVCEYERISRIKHGYHFRTKNYTIENQSKEFADIVSKWDVNYRANRMMSCINYCLDQENITSEDIDLVITSSLHEIPLLINTSKNIPHHQAHAASVFYTSPYDKAAILTVDGCGEILDYQSESARYSIGDNKHIKTLSSVNCFFDLTKEEKEAKYGLPHMVIKNSLGTFYQNMTLLIGMGYFGEGKSMGISAYGGANKIFDFIRDYVHLLPDGQFTINNREIFLKLKEIITDVGQTLDEDKLFRFKADMAYANQKILEEVVIHLCNYLYEETKYKNLCLAGGVALNSVANGKILKNTPFESIFIQPAAGDNGISIGCALYGEYEAKKQTRYYSNHCFSPYLGKDYPPLPQELTKDLTQLKFTETIYELVAKMVAEGYVVGWYNGRSEIGPRALGNRSILADPRCGKMRDYLNLNVKHREWFRPFAPAVLEEYVSEYFNISETSPYMLVVADVKTEKRTIVPAITHVDGTARLQTVNNELNHDFYKLIVEFYKLTGIPMVLNTSFNDAGDPIVETPEDAIKSFLNMDIDALMLNGKIYIKEHLIAETKSNALLAIT